MSYLEELQELLDTEGVDYKMARHPIAYTAQEVAGAQHVPGSDMVKAVIVKVGEEYMMCVLPSIHLVDFDKLKSVLGQDDLALASEQEVAMLFPECEVGAEAPLEFGHELPLIVDEQLEGNKEVVFNAGTHTDTIRMAYRDYKKLAHPKKVARIGMHI